MRKNIARLTFATALILQACTPNETAKKAIVSDTQFESCQAYGPEEYCRHDIFEDIASFGLIIEDFDNDGTRDILSYGHDRTDEVYFLRNNKFEQGPNSFFNKKYLGRDRHGCDAADINLDGHLDIYCSEGGHYGDQNFQNELFFGPPDNGPRKVKYRKVISHGAKDIKGAGSKVMFFNYDGDQWLDIFVANSSENGAVETGPSRIFKNLSGLDFELVQDFEFEEAGNTCLDKLDWDKDGRDEVLACSDKPGKTELIQFTDAELQNLFGKLPIKTDGLKILTGKFRDIDKDGDKDLLLFDARQGLIVFYNNAVSGFPFLTATNIVDMSLFVTDPLTLVDGEFLGSVSFETFDANDDGHQDIYFGASQLRMNAGGPPVTDRIIFGPDFRTFYAFSPTKTGSNDVHKYDDQSLIVSEARPDGKGAIFMLAPKSKFQTVTSDYATAKFQSRDITDCEAYGPAGLCRYELGQEAAVYGILVADVNSDGHLDILSHGHDWEDVIYFGRTFGFRPSGHIFVPGDRHFCDAADYDLNDTMDIYCSMGANKGEGEGPNELFDGQPSDAKTPYRVRMRGGHGAEDPTGRGRRVLFFRYDNDAYPDLFVSNWGERSDQQPVGSVLFKNEKGEKFSQLPSPNLGQAGLTCLDKMDWDNDGRDEIIACSKFRQSTRLLKNMPNGLENVIDSLPLKSRNFEAIDGKFIDFDNDGVEDLALLDRQQGLLLFKNTGHPEMPFTSLGAQISPEQILPNWDDYEAEIREGLLAFDSFDANGDGAQDIYIGLGIKDQNDPTQFLGDKLIYGPDFQASHTFETKLTGTHDVENYDSNGIVISQAGPNWGGKVFLLTSDAAHQK
ncbi:MAG: VCBS repeat-containing protein [Hellea sp.]|nr:VCBS repeat-containing protein [Hellea sp.]